MRCRRPTIHCIDGNSWRTFITASSTTVGLAKHYLTAVSRQRLDDELASFNLAMMPLTRNSAHMYVLLEL